MTKLGIEAPWYTFAKQVKALFDSDPDINVGDLCEVEDEFFTYVLDITVKNHEKYLALDRVMQKKKVFGNATVRICLYDLENTNEDIDDRIELYTKIFNGNPHVRSVERVTDFTGNQVGYVCFEPEVIQFPDDNISDIDGKWNGLAQDIAKELFEDDFFGVYFCTAKK